MKRAFAFPASLMIILALVFLTGNADMTAQERQKSLPQGASQNWWTAVQQDIEKEEYNISSAPAESKALYQAPNRAHGFRTYFTEEGIRVVPRTEQEDGWELGLSLVRFGRAGKPQLVARQVLSVHDNTADYHRGGISEWYINDARGLEQGFRISAPPDGEGPLILEMTLSGSLHPAFSEDKQAVTFFAPERNLSVLSYGQLLVTDAGGRKLPAWFEGAAGAGYRGIRIVMEDAGASYPITVDPSSPGR